MGYKVVFTDHSVYGFAHAGSIHMNKVLQFTLADVSQAICVSHTSKENTILRSGLPPEKVFLYQMLWTRLCSSLLQNESAVMKLL